MEAKRKLRSWKATFSKKDDFKVSEFSIAEEIHKIIENHKWKQLWLKQEERTGFASDQYIKTIKNALVQDDALVSALEAKLEKLSKHQNGLLLVTDLEALHPFMRVGQIESHLQGKFEIPTVFSTPESEPEKRD